MMEVEVAYALPHHQTLIKIEAELGATALTVIQQSGILQQFPEIDLNVAKIGIFSKFVTGDHIVKAGDRIEIYRPLLIDPKQARLLRVKKTAKMK